MVFGRNVNRYYLKYAWLLLLGITALFFVDRAQLMIPVFYRMLINGMNNGVVEYHGETVPFDTDFLVRHICTPLLLVAAVMVTGRCLWRIGFFCAGNRVDRDLRSRMFDHAKDLPQEYYQANKVGNLMSLYTNDLDTIQECFGTGTMVGLDAAFLGTMAFVEMFRMNAKMAFFAMLPMVLLIIIAVLLGKRMTAKWDERQEAFSELSDFSQESFSGIAVIKAFVKELKEVIAFRKLNKKNEKVNVEFTRYSVLLDVLIMLFVESVLGTILGYGGYLVYQKVFDAGELLEFFGYFQCIIWPVLAVSMLIQDTARARASVKRVDELLEVRNTVADRESVDPDFDPIKNGKIEFRNLTFCYPGTDRPVLSNISFQINPGEMVAVTGRTGAGKTTLVDLMAHIYNVPDGTVYFDGVDMNEISIRNVRKHIAYVPQDNFLFSESVASNIAFSLPDASDMEKIRNAAVLANVSGDIERFNERYQTVMGERGVTVSGGQKQRISIARALLKDAEILILDDSVSAVDTKTEKLILENLRKNRAGKTTILIAHRISTIEKADRILLLEDGRVVDMGTPAELTERCDEYKKMVELQRLEDEKQKGGAV